MLRAISLDSTFRALATQPFTGSSPTCVLGKRTVIYGRNGSGKTTFSEALRLAAHGGEADGSVVTAAIRKDGANSSVRLDERNFPWRVFVYNRHYVQDSLGLFLDGSGGSPTILKIGAANVAATSELFAARAHLDVLRGRGDALIATRRTLERERTALERQVKGDIIAALSASDPARYNTTTFQVTRVRTLLADASLVVLTDEYLVREVAAASAAVVSPTDKLVPWPALASDLRRMINDELLSLPVESEVLPRLNEDRLLSAWVEAGLQVHRAGDTCKFCSAGTLTTEVLESYHLHFSEAMNNLRARLQKALEYLDERASKIAQWNAALPDSAAFLSDFRARYELAKDAALQTSERTLSQIKLAMERIAARLADPLVPLPTEQRLHDEFTTFDTVELDLVIQENRDACDEQGDRKALAQKTVEEHYSAVEGPAYRRLLDRLKRVERAEAAVERRAAALRLTITRLEQSQDDTSRMAIEIDADVRNHFGHKHLRIEVSDDGKGYVVLRDSTPATRLSEGERNAIAFAYFLRTLDADGVDPSKSIVVIDDPVTSMDKESLFAGFALAEERTKDFAQVMVLTHDYEYFRLQLRQRRNARKASTQRIREGNANEIAFPAVAVLEMVATLDRTTGQRTSGLRPMPGSLIRHPSEYHYLFFRVGHSVLTSDAETLPLMGNAARRLLEGFISFRAPAFDDFQQKVDAIQRAENLDPVLARRIVKFLHGMSHREEPCPTSALDFPSIEQELCASLEFMHLADHKHFKDMCKAVELDYLSLVGALQSVSDSE
ncbi:AAA family ATPase [Microbacterium sp. NPDC089987]|uniref:AAA family ATPase n=1 Tax=Microbacterium sp. NPDC089987 TaxID=3364202 RepID=UPI0037F1AE18